MKLSTILQRGRARIADPNHWWNGEGSTMGLRECAVSALEGLPRNTEARTQLAVLALCLYDEPTTFVNDHHGHAAVLALYDAAISAALSDEAP